VAPSHLPRFRPPPFFAATFRAGFFAPPFAVVRAPAPRVPRAVLGFFVARFLATGFLGFACFFAFACFFVVRLFAAKLAGAGGKQITQSQQSGSCPFRAARCTSVIPARKMSTCSPARSGGLNLGKPTPTSSAAQS